MPSLQNLASAQGSLLGGLIVGGIEPVIGITASLLAFGVIYALATTSLLVNPALRGMDARRAQAASDAA